MYTFLIINNSLVIVHNGALPKQNSSQIAQAFNMACAISLAEYVHNVDGKHSRHHSTVRPAGPTAYSQTLQCAHCDQPFFHALNCTVLYGWGRTMRFITDTAFTY